MQESLINPDVTAPDFGERLAKAFKYGKPLTAENAQLVNSPFQALQLKNVINKPKYIKKLQKLLISKIKFNLKSNDLYTLKQSIDLNNIDDNLIKMFIYTLQNELGPLLSRVMGVKFNDKISVTASLYERGDVLLCHDDKCEDRSVAFVYYLSKDHQSSDGGTFDMFDHNPETGQPTTIVNSVEPEYNSFLAFKVGNLTYHQVSEITSSSYKRLSVNGWFHSSEARKIVPLSYKDPMPLLLDQESLKGLVLLNDYINVLYCGPSTITNIQSKFIKQSEIALSNFFNKKIFKKCSQDLNEISDWKYMGPPNRRNFEIVDNTKLPEHLGRLVQLLKSSLFVSFLKNLTGLSLESSSGSTNGCKLVLQVQQWSSKCYTMVTDNDSFFTYSGLDLYLFFNVPDNYDPFMGGSVTYLAADEDDELMSIDPANNTLLLVYRTDDTVRFTKYLSSRLKGKYHCISCTYYEPSEVEKIIQSAS